MHELNQILNALFAWQMLMTLVGLATGFFFMWMLYIYVTSRRDWFEEDIRVREAEKSQHLARAEQIRVETASLKHRLEKEGITLKESEFNIR